MTVAAKKPAVAGDGGQALSKSGADAVWAFRAKWIAVRLKKTRQEGSTR
jgi:hypothetical protein